jgi:hypothetical protein
MHIDIHEQPGVGFLIEFSELALLVVAVLVIIDQQFCSSDGRTNLPVSYVFSIEDCP